MTVGRPDDEDTTPRAAYRPARRGAPVPATAAPPPAPVPERVRFGVVGTVNKPGILTDMSGRPGVIRLVSSSIRYEPPPLAPYVWTPIPDEPGRYELAWDGPADQVRTLATLGKALREASKHKQLTSTAHPLLRQLDAAARSLLSATRKLHAKGWSVGLLQPDNVLLVPVGEDVEVVLPDLGFSWQGEFGDPPWRDSPGRPDWLDDDQGRNPAVRLWDEEPALQQLAAPGLHPEGQAEPHGDVRVIARLFAWVLSGRPAKELPELAKSAAHFQAWEILRSAIDGRISMPEELQKKLKEVPLNSHFYMPDALRPVKEEPAGSKLPLVLFFLLLLAGAAGGGYWWYQTKFKGTTAVASFTSRTTGAAITTEPTTSKQAIVPAETLVGIDWDKPPGKLPDGSALAAAVAEVEKTTALDDRAAALEKLYRQPLNNDPAKMKQEVQTREHLRGQYVADWLKEYKRLNAEATTDVTRRADLGPQVRALSNHLTKLQPFPVFGPALGEKEKQCRELSDLRASELGSSR